MPTQFTPVSLLEVPLPADAMDNPCLPLVIMQPSADISNYMLKSNYATNGQPGVVDHALVADSLDGPLPQHGLQHIQTGDDPIPLATAIGVDGLCPGGNGSPTSYLGGDVIFRELPSISRLRGEGKCVLDPAANNGTTIFTGVINNPVSGVYVVDYGYLYDAASPTPAGLAHFDVYDASLPGWVAATSQVDLSALNSKTVLLRPIIMSAVMTRVFAAQPNSLTWRLYLDQAGGIASQFQVGFAFALLSLTNL